MISENLLFHYTSRFQSLQGIIDQGFEFRESEEELPLGGYGNCIFDQLGISVHLQSPRIVCFCDLPLTQTSAHRLQYGEYAIAMTKEWGMRKGVTPVRYVHAKTPDFNSDFYNSVLDIPNYLRSQQVDIHGLFARILRENQVIPAATDDEMKAVTPGVKKIMDAVNCAHMRLIEEVQRLLPFVRLYEGEWIDRVDGKSNYRLFYDEREWRAAASGEEQFLTFVSDDVAYFIVSTNEERDILTKQLSNVEDINRPDHAKSVWTKIRLAAEVWDVT